MLRRNSHAVSFEIIKRRWVVERTLPWFGRNCRLAEDYENLTAIQFGFKRLARN